MRISREGNLATVINVFETKPEQQQELIDQWIRFVESIKEEPGLIGTTLHRSTDGTRVVNYAQWRSKEDFESFVKKYREQMEAPICTKSSISLSRQAVDRQREALSGKSMSPPPAQREESRWRDGTHTWVGAFPSPLPSERFREPDCDEALENQR